MIYEVYNYKDCKLYILNLLERLLSTGQYYLNKIRFSPGFKDLLSRIQINGYGYLLLSTVDSSGTHSELGPNLILQSRINIDSLTHQ